jgi:hypothetical protein
MVLSNFLNGNAWRPDKKLSLTDADARLMVTGSDRLTVLMVLV